MIRIVTDSAADLTARDLETPGVTVVPMGITFADGTATVDDGSMTKDEFFTRLAEDSKLPRTSQPSPASFIELFEDAADAGDEVIVITVAQKLSGTYQCASLAAAETDAKVYIIDSETATQGEAIIAREAIRLREQGLSASRIAAELETFKKPGAGRCHRGQPEAPAKGRPPACRRGYRGRCTGHQTGADAVRRCDPSGRQRPRPSRCAGSPVPPVGQAGRRGPGLRLHATVQRR